VTTLVLNSYADAREALKNSLRDEGGNEAEPEQAMEAARRSGRNTDGGKDMASVVKAGISPIVLKFFGKEYSLPISAEGCSLCPGATRACVPCDHCPSEFCCKKNMCLDSVRVRDERGKSLIEDEDDEGDFSCPTCAKGALVLQAVETNKLGAAFEAMVAGGGVHFVAAGSGGGRSPLHVAARQNNYDVSSEEAERRCTGSVPPPLLSDDPRYSAWTGTDRPAPSPLPDSLETRPRFPWSQFYLSIPRTCPI
jgi:hypothetical protein